MRKKKRDTIRIINRVLDKAISRYGRAIAPQRQPRDRPFFDMLMNEITGAPKRRR